MFVLVVMEMTCAMDSVALLNSDVERLIGEGRGLYCHKNVSYCEDLRYDS
jgi:hypothetical protein